MPHPMELLRNILAEEFTSDLPSGVHPVPGWCADPQFFPGATGLVQAESWADVVPGSDGVLEQLPPVSPGGVIALGNYQASAESYRRIHSGEIGGLRVTWHHLAGLLASVSPGEVFLTNSFIGLPGVVSDTAPFPTTREFTARCQRLLALAIDLLEPRCIVCMGTPAARFISAMSPDLAVWRPWPGLGILEAKSLRIVPGCRFKSRTVTVVAVAHPSSRISTEQREAEAALVAKACA